MIGAPGRGPSVLLPLRYLVAAAGAFLLVAVSLPWLAPDLAGHYYQPRIFALTHTVTLGWITLTIMGASYQIIPIVLERPVWSERLGRWQFALLVVGIVGMVGHFFIGEWSGLLWGAGLVGLGTIAHLVNAVMSVRGLRRWTFTARLVAMALAGFALTLLFGLILAINRLWTVLPPATFPLVHAHFHLALLGWVLPMVIGVAARIYPMFLLAREPEGWPGHAQLWGLSLGVPAVVIGILASRPLLLAGALAVTAAVLGHGLWVLGMVRTARRPRLDCGLRLVLAGAFFLAPATLLGLAFAIDVVAGPRPALAYAVLTLGGWASLTVAGVMLKVIPFLVWYLAYSPHVGRARVPTLAQLSSPLVEGVAFGLLTAGMAALAGAALIGEVWAIRTAGTIVAAGALAFAVTLARVIGHLRSARTLSRRTAGGRTGLSAHRIIRIIAGGSGPTPVVTPDHVTQALREVFDPELGMSIVELGMVYGVDVRGGAVAVTMTLTAPGCPIHDVMPQWVKKAVAKLPGVEQVDVTITFDPPWTPDRITP